MPLTHRNPNGLRTWQGQAMPGRILAWETSPLASSTQMHCAVESPELQRRDRAPMEHMSLK
eukprot:scaffold49521_cov33-Tisochrysis_lutea.AAC.5